MNNLTTAPVQPGDFSAAAQEFGRVADVTRTFGLKRSTLYNLYSAGKIHGVLLRVEGNKSGVRLFEMASIRSFIRGQMNCQGDHHKRRKRRARRGSQKTNPKAK